MPEALRKRLDAREADKQEQRSRKPNMGGRSRADSRTFDGPQSPEASTDDFEDADGAGLWLPQLESRGRRVSSQPPVYVPEGAEREKRKKARPQSVGMIGAEDDGEKCGRQMFDKNTLRTNHRDLFLMAVRLYREERCRPNPNDGDCSVSLETGQMINVCLRKRPMFEKEEQQRGDYDVLSVMPGSPVPTQVAMHNCLFQADLKTPFVTHLMFTFDRVFDEKASNDEVYRSCASNLVQSCLEGGVGTMFMFGQTGSGKTHTMAAIQELASRDLFAEAEGGEMWLSVQFVELRGNRCFDLLAPGVASTGGRKDARPELRLREQHDGSYAAEGAVDLYPTTPEELCAIMEMAQSRRATSATDANSVSSRSHAVCKLRLLQCEGQLMLVDCAGTERKKDSMYHSKERQQEGAEINASLHALKECIRLLTTQQRVPSHAFRASSLTKILADAFTKGERAKLAVICTASPCATDTEHTISTLRMGMGLGGKGSEQEEKQSLSDLMRKPRLVHPKQWNPDQVFDWLRGVYGGQFQDAADALPSNFTGHMLVRLTENRCVQLCNGNEKRGRRLFDVLHQEIQRVESSRKG
ncbi:unnamed protein product [Polarella glacialis]|uniref:Kinesin motor domain-containing protein n=1 Tax=Polarella glacialis TaxID=89957 RepID=A0A813FH28_POLGL|nr:unnamed protein product [Polarella glacialis]